MAPLVTVIQKQTTKMNEPTFEYSLITIACDTNTMKDMNIVSNTSTLLFKNLNINDQPASSKQIAPQLKKSKNGNKNENGNENETKEKKQEKDKEDGEKMNEETKQKEKEKGKRGESRSSRKNDENQMTTKIRQECHVFFGNLITNKCHSIYYTQSKYVHQ